MKKFLSIVIFFFKSFYALPEIRNQNNRLNVKSIAKVLGIILLVAYVLASFAFLAWQVYYSMYSVFASVGLQKLLIIYALLYGSIMTAVLCILTVISTIYSNDMETYVATLPIRTSHIIAGKAATIAIAQLWLALLVIGSGLGIYWYFEKVSFLFLINAILFIILITMLSTAIGYLVGLPLLSLSKFIRNRDRVMIFAGFLVMIFVLFFIVTTNRIMSMTTSPEALMKMLEGSNRSFLSLYDNSPALKYIVTSFLDAQNPIYMVSFVLMLGITLGVVYFIFELLAPLYRYVIRNFSESYIKKLDRKQAKLFLGKAAQRSSSIKALVLRELRLMNREPVYFMNGPFVIILMPLILGISLYINILSNQNITNKISNLTSVVSPVVKILLVSLFGAFLGSATSITCTSISRDAKHLAFMKSLPISIKSYLGAKLIHGCIFGFLGSTMSVALGALILQLQFSEILLALLISLALSVTLNIIGLILDTLNPQLKWESPIAALKQNINAVIVILGEMVILGGLSYIGFTKITSVAGLGFLLGLMPALLSVILLVAYFPFAERRIRRLDV